jgi:hypothetical protein
MTYQDYIIASMEKVTGDIFRAARAVPADKVEWRPLGEGRSVLDILQECAQSPQWITGLVLNKKFPDVSPEEMAKGREARKQWKTIDDCENASRENCSALYAAIREVPESEFGLIVHLPFGGGIDLPLMAVMGLHYWNTVYHSGQVNYIQTLYGDKDMH